MHIRHCIYYFLILSGVHLALQAQEETIVQGDGGDQLSLLDNSPFIPDGWREPVKSGPGGRTKAQSRDIEFRGYFTLKEVTKFNLYNKRKRQGNWYELNKEIDGVVVNSWSPLTKSVTVSVGGKRESFELSKPSDRPMAVQVTSRRTTGKISNRNSSNTKRRTVTRPTTTRRISRVSTRNSPNSSISTSPRRPINRSNQSTQRSSTTRSNLRDATRPNTPPNWKPPTSGHSSSGSVTPPTEAPKYVPTIPKSIKNLDLSKIPPPPVGSK